MTKEKLTSELYQARENLRMLEKCPTWYDHLDAINAATAEWDRVYAIRTKVGWDLDEDGWYAPCPETQELIPEGDWLDHGLLYPEDL